MKSVKQYNTSRDQTLLPRNEEVKVEVHEMQYNVISY